MNNIKLDIEALRKVNELLIKVYEGYNRCGENPGIHDIYADSCVKRFEYTLEAAWKIMKKYLKLQYFL